MPNSSVTRPAMWEMLHELRVPVVRRLAPKNLFGAFFWLMKITVAFQMLKDAQPGTRLVESTSGTMGFGLALTCHAMGFPLTLVGDPSIDPALKNLMEEVFGADVHIVTERRAVGGYQVPRLRFLNKILSENPNAFWTRQYDNPSNADAYRDPAAAIHQAFAAAGVHVDYLVAPVGSGGSISGITRFLRAAGHPAHAVAVDTHGSVLFGQRDGPRPLRGLGNSIHPLNLDYELIDTVHWVQADHAFCSTRQLFAEFGLDRGPTTGAAYFVARYLARLHPGSCVLFLSPDRAERYLSTVYSRSFCESHGLWTEDLPDAPAVVSEPSRAGTGWQCYSWNRKKLTDIIPASAIRRADSFAVSSGTLEMFAGAGECT